MDFSSIRRKHKAHEYICIESVRNDFNLMMSNCQRYNARNTLYYNEATRLTNQSQSIFERYEKQYNDIGFDKETGLFANKAIYDLITRPDIHDFNNRKIYQLELEINKSSTIPSCTELTVDTQCQSHQSRSLESYSSTQDEFYSMCVDK